MYPGVHGKTTPDKPAVIMAGSGEVVSYRQLDERSNQGALGRARRSQKEHVLRRQDGAEAAGDDVLALGEERVQIDA